MPGNKKVVMTKVLNTLKETYPEFDYELCSRAILIDPEIKETTSSISDFKIFIKNMNTPITEPAKILAEKSLEILESKKKSSSDIESVKEIKVVDKGKKRKLSKNKKGKKVKKIKNICDQTFSNEGRKLLFSKEVNFWQPIRSSGKQIYATCYCHVDAGKRKNRFNQSVDELYCANSKKKCNFILNCSALVELMRRMKNWGIEAMPRFYCSCRGKNSLCMVRGSDPKVENFELWYTCPDCKYVFYLSEPKLEKKIIEIGKTFVKPSVVCDPLESDDESDETDEGDESSEDTSEDED